MSTTTNLETTARTGSCCAPSCCGGEEKSSSSSSSTKAEAVTAVVREQYAGAARSGLSSDVAGVRAVAEAFGYSPQELDGIPAEANMGLSCGNPTAFASLRPGETVVDLGCGGGMDVFLAAQKIGPAGRAIGIDMTPEMIALAKKNAQGGPGRKPVGNVEFHLASIDALPLADGSADCVISNCVINLAPDKRAVFREIFRVLKPGGRVAVSDIALKRPLPEELETSIAAYVGCIAGAITIAEYREGLAAVGFDAVDVMDGGSDLNAYTKVDGQSGCCSPAPQDSSCCGGSTESVHAELGELLRRYDVNAYAASVKVYALKPR